MVDYATEDEQLEALKRWWRENGRAVILGVTIGVLALGGWRGWEWYSERQAHNASALYDQLLGQIAADDYAGVSEQAAILRGDYSGTAYAELGTLAAAALAVRADELGSAEQWLRWVLDHTADPQREALARARLARVLDARGRSDESLALLDMQVPRAYTALYAEIRGDVLRARGETEAAVAAYQRALDAEVGPVDPRVVERKIHSVRSADAPAQGSGS